MTDTLQQALDTPGCERLRDFASVGPAQKAALELFVDRIRAAEPEEHAKSLVAEIKRLKERAVPMTEEEIVVMFDEMVNRAAPRDFIVKFARAIEARKAAPMTDEEMILRGWRRCAVGQRTTQYCGQVEALLNMLQQFTKTPSTGADSEARIAGHKALTALEKYKPKE